MCTFHSHPFLCQKIQEQRWQAFRKPHELQLNEPEIALPTWRSNDDDNDASGHGNIISHKIKIVYVDAEDVKLRGIAILCEGHGETFLMNHFSKGHRKNRYMTCSTK